MRMKDKKSAFTLVELLVVLMVIGVLAGIIFSGATFLFGEQGIKQAKTELEILQLCLDEYRRDIGSYPITEDLGDSKECGFVSFKHYMELMMKKGISLAKTLTEKCICLWINLKRMYLRKVKIHLVDPWGEPYQYNFPRRDGHEGYLLFSKGPDKKSQVFDAPSDGIPEKLPLTLTIFLLPNPVSGNSKL